MIRMLAAFAVCAVGSFAAAAQQLPSGPTGLLIDRGRIDRPQTPPPPPAAGQTGVRDRTGRVESGASGSATLITGVRFDGTDVPRSVGDAAQRFIGQKATPDTLKALVAAMSDTYAKSAVALYTLAVPAQSFRGGIVHVRVAEGFIEHVTITGDVKRRSVALVRRYAELLAAEHPLRRATLERYLSYVRDIPGLTLQAQLLRGTRAGGVTLVLQLKQKRTDVALSFDNRTQDQLASGEFTATAKAFGALRPGDETDLTLATGSEFKSYQYVGLAHSTPIGHDGLRASISVAHLATRTEQTDISGTADVASLGISQSIIRSYKRNLTLGLSADGVNSDNALLGSLLARERTRAARAAAYLTDVAGKHSVSASLTVSRGLDILGAATATTLADPTFTKVNGRINVGRAIGKHVTVRLASAGQWTGDALPAVERFIVGGPDFGRAFPVAVLAADRGIAGSGELAWRPGISKALQNSELYVFGDGAKVRYLGRGPIPAAGYDLASAGGGIRLALRDRARLELEAARPIDVPYPGYRKAWQFNVAWRLALRRK